VIESPAGPELVEGSPVLLQPHRDHLPREVERIEASMLSAHPHWLRIRWRIEGAGQLVLPPFAGRGRADGLWQTTCFELFLRPAGTEGYLELNLSPSQRWNAYAFDNYRAGMREAPMPRDPGCIIRQAAGVVIFDAAIPLAGLPREACAMGISAVIEEAGGHKSWWALAHPPGKPDFHADACFAATLAAPVGA
jgi:hypothetical protein